MQGVIPGAEIEEQQVDEQPIPLPQNFKTEEETLSMLSALALRETLESYRNISVSNSMKTISYNH